MFWNERKLKTGVNCRIISDNNFKNICNDVDINAREVLICLHVKCTGTREKWKNTSDISRYHVCLCMHQKKQPEKLVHVCCAKE